MATPGAGGVGPDGNWKASQFRAKVVGQINDALRDACNPIEKSGSELEEHIFNRARDRDSYLSLVARLILHMRDSNAAKEKGLTGRMTPNMAGQQQGGGVATTSMNQVDNHVLEIIGEDSPAIQGIVGGADSLASRPSTSVASPSCRWSKSTNSSPSPAAHIPRAKSSVSAEERSRQPLYDEYLQVEMKRCKLDIERIQAEKEKIFLEKQKIQLEILKLRFEIEEKTHVKVEDVIDLGDNEI